MMPGEADIALLRRFEPVLRFNRGEQFYPMDAELYLRNCGLHVRRPDEPPEELVARGSLSIERLIEPRPARAGEVYYLSFADPAPPWQVRQFRQQSSLREFHAGQGRLTRVGPLARLADLLFSISLLLRGRAPGGLAVAAALRYQPLFRQQPHYCYYGRVVREHGYIALQYWFFYAFNDWRSSFNGVNDHEADWEMITVYLAEDAAESPQPVWLAYSSHEFEGDDIRRSWRDPDIERIGEHPVVYVAAGAHANYYFRGEYLPVSEVPFAAPLLRFWNRVRRFWNVTLRQGEAFRRVNELSFVRIPFVDYARGDGLSIGPGQNHGWELRLLQATAGQPAPAWVDRYRGLWGLYTRDPIAGEDAPAGPKYNRDGTVRRSWYDPLSWSGLNKVPPPEYTEGVLLARRGHLEDEQQTLQRSIADQTAELMGLEIEMVAIRTAAHLRARAADLRRRIREAAVAIDQLKARRAANEIVLARFEQFAGQIARGEHIGPRDHLRLPQMPASPAELRLGRLAETWSALSIGLLLFGFVAIAIFFSSAWEIGLLALIGIYGFMEALFQRQIQTLVRYIVVGLALVSTLILVYEFFPFIVVFLVLSAGILVIIDNLRELRS